MNGKEHLNHVCINILHVLVVLQEETPKEVNMASQPGIQVRTVMIDELNQSLTQNGHGVVVLVYVLLVEDYQDDLHGQQVRWLTRN